LRLGREKALLELDGENMLQRVISRLRSLDDDIILVAAEGQQLPRLNGYKRLKVVTDIYPGKGPLVGIYSGLLNSDSVHNLVVACDMPFLNRRLLSHMLEAAAGYDVVIPRVGNKYEPLHAVYSKRCIGVIEKLLAGSNLKIDRLLDIVKVRYVETDEIDSFDPQRLSFFNINTRTDLKKAGQLAGEVAQ